MGRGLIDHDGRTFLATFRHPFGMRWRLAVAEGGDVVEGPWVIEEPARQMTTNNEVWLPTGTFDHWDLAAASWQPIMIHGGRY